MLRRTVLLVVLALVCPALGGDIVGWRGDGSGIYPNTEPPVQWQRVSKAVAALRFQTEPPKGDESGGQAMADGIIRQWLILGPVPAEKGAKGGLTDALLVEDQSKLTPAAGQELGGASWKKVETDSAYIDCARLFDTYGKKPDQVAYAHAYLYTPADADFVVRVMHTAAVHLWINGKPTHKFADTELNYTPQAVKLTKGWNRVLVRITPQHATEQPITPPWYVSLAFQSAPQKAEYDQSGIAWRTALPAVEGFGGPIIVGGRIYLLSEPADLVCLDAATGKILWLRSNNYHELASDEERQAQPEVFGEIEPLAARLNEVNGSFCTATPPKVEAVQGREEFKEKVGLEQKLYALMRKVDRKKYALPNGQDVGYAGLTPASDGKHVFAWFATGVTCCYDLDGKLVWRRLDNEGSFFEHGYSSSPLLADGKLVVVMNKLLAFDAASGALSWATDLQGVAKRFHGTPMAARIGQTSVCILPTGHIIRLTDGKVLRDKGPEFGGLQQEIPSPVVAGDTIYHLSTYSQLHQVVLPAETSEPLKVQSVRELKMDLSRYPTFYLPWHMASPLVHDGLAYCVNNTGVLSVVDVKTMQIVYEKLLDLDHFQSAHEGAGRGIGISPSLAGGRIYLVGNTGSTLVIEPGRTYKQLAKNKLETVFWRYWGLRHERFVGAPTFDGKRMYLRGERFLYCLSAE